MKRDVLSRRQIIVLLFSGLLSLSVELIPSLAAQRTGSAGWLIPVVMLPLLLLSARTGAGVFGLPEGAPRRIIYIMYMAQILVLAAVVLRMGSLRLEQINGRFPAWLSAAVLLSAALWMGFGKTAAFARAGEIFYLALAVVIAGAIFLGLLQVEPENLAVDMAGLASLPGAGLHAVGIILNVYPVLTLWTKVAENRQSRGKEAGWIAAFCIVLALVLAVVIGCLGPELTASWDEPFYIMVQGVGIKGAFQRTEALVAAMLCLSDFVLVGSLLHAWRILADGVRPGSWGKRSLFMTVPAAAAAWLLSEQQVRRLTLRILPVTGVVMGLVFPLIFCGISALRKRRK